MGRSHQDRAWAFGVWVCLTGMLLTGLLWGTDWVVVGAAIAGSGLGVMFNVYNQRKP